LPAQIIEIARWIGRDHLISVYPPEDTADLRMLVRCHPSFEREMTFHCGASLDAPCPLTLHELAEVVRGAASAPTKASPS